MKFSELLKAEMDRREAAERNIEKFLSGLRFNRKFWEKVAEFKASGKNARMLWEYMMSTRPMYSSSELKPSINLCSYLIDENGDDIASRRDIYLEISGNKMFERALENHGVLVEDGQFKIPDDMEIPEDSSAIRSSEIHCLGPQYYPCRSIPAPDNVSVDESAILDRIIDSANKAQELYEKISSTNNKPKSPLSKLKFWK